jgi:hypothetical protein
MGRTEIRLAGFTLAALFAVAGCGRQAPKDSRAAVPLPLRIVADTGRSVPLAVVVPDRPPADPPSAGAPPARAWIASVSRDEPSALDLPPPVPRSDTLAADFTAAPTLVMDEDLKAPIPIGLAPLALPRARRSTSWVELDVRIDENGAVSDALWADGSADSSIVAATTACALAMRFHPALRHGVPVAVWCRQRFEIGHGGVPRPASGGD